MCPHAQAGDGAAYAREAPAVHHRTVLDPLAGLRALQAARAAAVPQSSAELAALSPTPVTPSSSAALRRPGEDDSRSSERRPLDAVEGAGEDSPVAKKAKANNTIVSRLRSLLQRVSRTSLMIA